MVNRKGLAPALLIAAGLWQCVAVGDAINADGVSYLDLAQQYASGDWSALSNGYWSPLYPLLIGVALRVVGWLGISELAVTYALNLVLLAFAIVSFRKLLDALSVDEGPGAESREPRTENRRFGDPWSRAAAWALFAWMMIRMISVASVTPDVLVAALLFQATAIIARRAQAVLPARSVAAFGAVLGVAYASKAVMFPAGIVLLLAFALVARRNRAPRGPAHEMVGAVAAFALIAVPLVTVQSRAAGHLTIGETGRLNYAWFVNSAAPATAGVTTATRAPGSAIVLAGVPDSRLFADSAPGTFPYWYDPARWSPGVDARFDAAKQLQVLQASARWYRVAAGVPFLLAFLFIVMAVEAGRTPRRELWPILAAPVALVVMYALVHVEGRLTGAALVTLLVALLAMADGNAGAMRSHSRELLYAALVAFGTIASVQRLVTGPRLGASRDAADTAAAIQRVGVPARTDVVVFGWPTDQGIYWAHVAGVRIVAAIPTAAAGGMTPSRLDALSQEICGHGRAIRAVVGRDSAWARAANASTLGDGWFAWLPASLPSGCPRR